MESQDALAARTHTLSRQIYLRGGHEIDSLRLVSRYSSVVQVKNQMISSPQYSLPPRISSCPAQNGAK